MGEILGRGQHQLAQRQVAGIEVQRPRLCRRGILPCRCSRDGRSSRDACSTYSSSQRFVWSFTSTSRSGSNGRWKAKKTLLQPRPHRGVVVVRLGEVEPRALQRDRSPRLDGPLPRPIQRRLVPAERGQEEQDGRVGSGLAHEAHCKGGRRKGEGGSRGNWHGLPTADR